MAPGIYGFNDFAGLYSAQSKHLGSNLSELGPRDGPWKA